MRISKSTKTSVKANSSTSDYYQCLQDALVAKGGYSKSDVADQSIATLESWAKDAGIDIDNLCTRKNIKSSTSTVKASNKTSSLKSMSDDQLENLMIKVADELESYGEDDMSDRVLYLEDLCAAINKELDCRKSNKSCNSSTSTDKALQHIKAAIDILGKSGKKDAVTKDSIANLGVVMFDLKSKK